MSAPITSANPGPGPDGHRVQIRLTYLEGVDGPVPYKWRGVCTCGWKALSWSFSRALSAANDPVWELEGNLTTGGVLPMTLEHLRVAPPPTPSAAPSGTERPLDQPDINPAVVSRDPLLREIADLLASLNLHLGKFEWSRLSTRHKELFADLVDSDAVLDPADPTGVPARTPRWWRGSWDGPEGPHDPRWHDDSLHEPDPFIYGEHRTTPPPTYLPPDAAAVARGRGACMGQAGPFAAEDTIAVYEWAKTQAKPFRATVGDQAGQIIATMAVYPSLNEAREFLAGYRAARQERWESR